MRIGYWSSDVCSSDLVVVGGGAADRARLDVGDRHFRAGNRLAVCAGDLATDTGGCALRESGRGGECGDQPKRQLGKSETGMVHVCLASIRLTVVAHACASLVGIRNGGPHAPHKIGRAPSELQSLMRISYAVFCLTKKTDQYNTRKHIDCSDVIN